MDRDSSHFEYAPGWNSEIQVCGASYIDDLGGIPGWKPLPHCPHLP